MGEVGVVVFLLGGRWRQEEKNSILPKSELISQGRALVPRFGGLFKSFLFFFSSSFSQTSSFFDFN